MLNKESHSHVEPVMCFLGVTKDSGTEDSSTQIPMLIKLWAESLELLQYKEIHSKLPAAIYES